MEAHITIYFIIGLLLVIAVGWVVGVCAFGDRPPSVKEAKQPKTVIKEGTEFYDKSWQL